VKLTPIDRSKAVDRSPQMTLEEAAERCKVDTDWLRNFVGRKGVKPTAQYSNPTRRYYSLTQIRNALREERRGHSN